MVDNNDKQECEILPEDYPNYDLNFKIIVIGDAGIYIYLMKVLENHVLQ